MSKTFDAHIAAIRSGSITRTTVIGVRKAITACNKRRDGWGVSRTQADISPAQCDTACDELRRVRPVVCDELHESGLAQLRNRRYRRQLEAVADIIADIQSFHLIGFELIGHRGVYATPIYEARDSQCRAFSFINIPWQAGGNGPEVLSGPYRV